MDHHNPYNQEVEPENHFAWQLGYLAGKLSGSTLRLSGLSVDFAERSASINGNILNLTTKEYQVLEILCITDESVVSKNRIMRHLYGFTDQPDEKIIDVLVFKLRKKLANALDGKKLIVESGGCGYKLMHSLI